MIEQVRNIARTTIIQDAWRRGHPVELHGWIYGLTDGLIHDLGITLAPRAEDLGPDRDAR